MKYSKPTMYDWEVYFVGEAAKAYYSAAAGLELVKLPGLVD
jgi:hypothetical protein